MQQPRFYAVIIGTEILNGRREDKHFTFVRNTLIEYGYQLFATFIVKDDIPLLTSIFELIKQDKQSVLFSFGGIGSTPDDYTRQIAANVFADGLLYQHNEFYQNILNKFGQDSFPHRVKMADLPKESELLFNPVNNMSGFFVEKRFFFMPGFPQMAHPMLMEAMDRFFPKVRPMFRLSLYAHCSENDLIHLMQSVPKTIELSSLPEINAQHRAVTLSLLGENEEEVRHYLDQFIVYLRMNHITYTLSNIK